MVGEDACIARERSGLTAVLSDPRLRNGTGVAEAAGARIGIRHSARNHRDASG